MTGLILTPGYECENASTTHYSVYVAPEGSETESQEDTKRHFSSPCVQGALFLQHHMMKKDAASGQMLPRPQTEIAQYIRNICEVNEERAKHGCDPLECAFDCEPAPVQSRRYHNNPPEWPQEPLQQAEKLYQLVLSGELEHFLDEIDDKGYYPMCPSNQTVGQIAKQDLPRAERIAQAIGTITGRVMGRLGINMLYAPVCDLNASAFVERCYGDDPDLVVPLATAWAAGALSQKGVSRICLKHAPGHGVSINQDKEGHQDTHNTQCISTESLEQIDRHMQVFTSVAERLLDQGVPHDAIRVMTNHITYQAIDPSSPISTSKEGIAYIQDRLPEGIKCIADCINMAGFAADSESFFHNLDITRDLHTGGVIATTHFVKKASRDDLIAHIEQKEPSSSPTV